MNHWRRSVSICIESDDSYPKPVSEIYYLSYERSPVFGVPVSNSSLRRLSA